MVKNRLIILLANISVRTETSIHNMSIRCHSVVRSLLKNTNRNCKRKISPSKYPKKGNTIRTFPFPEPGITRDAAWILPGLNSLTFVFGLEFWDWGDLFWLRLCWCHFCIAVSSQGHIKIAYSQKLKPLKTSNNPGITYFGELWF